MLTAAMTCTLRPSCLSPLHPTDVDLHWGIDHRLQEVFHADRAWVLSGSARGKLGPPEEGDFEENERRIRPHHLPWDAYQAVLTCQSRQTSEKWADI